MKRIFNIVLAGMLICLAFSFSSCKEDYVERPVTKKSQMMIAEYLNSRADLSLFKEIADKAKKSRSYKDATGAWDTILNVPDSVAGYIRYGALLNSYGTYTVFVPNNDAIMEYLKSINCTSVSQMDSVQLEEFMAAHLVQQQVTLRAYISGTMKISDSTTTGVRHYVDVPGFGQDIILDKVASVKNNAMPKETFNGYVYEITKVLPPHANYLEGYLKDAGKYTESDGSRFTVMLKAFEEVGMTKSVLRTIRTPHRDSVMRTKAAFETFFPTVLAVSDSAYAAKGIT
ncbi:MAG: fasciclin domain-containing protein, partial [Bacteroidales bacterium]|nr:fasciclin domain-containing protein [Bacteroidales bacterium]